MKFGEEKYVTEVDGHEIKNPYFELPVNLALGEPWPPMTEQWELNEKFRLKHPGERARITVFEYKPFKAASNKKIDDVDNEIK